VIGKNKESDMKAEVLVDIIRSGKKPLVKLTGPLWSESFGGAGMIARVVGCKVRLYTFREEATCIFDYNEHREHNLGLDKADWIIGADKTGKAIDAGIFDDPNNLQEDVVFSDADEEISVELME